MKYKFIVLLPLLFWAGCATKTIEPSQISYDFWLAEKEQKIKKAAQYTLKKDPDATKLHNKIKIKNIKTQKPKVKNNKALVPTTLELENLSLIQKKSSITPVSFETVMYKKEDGWKIDMFETKKALYLAVGKAYAENMGKNFAENIDHLLGNGKELQGALQQLINGIQKSFRE